MNLFQRLRYNAQLRKVQRLTKIIETYRPQGICRGTPEEILEGLDKVIAIEIQALMNLSRKRHPQISERQSRRQFSKDFWEDLKNNPKLI